jgi:hypothetical protein
MLIDSLRELASDLIRHTACSRWKWLCWLSQPLTLRPSVAMIRRASFLAQLFIVALLACGKSATPPGADASKRGITAAATYSLRSAVLSPDTSRIAYATDTSYRTISELWVINTKIGAKPVRVATGIGPSWSPDGKLLAFHSLVSDDLQLFVWHAGTGKTRQITKVAGGIQPSDYVSVYPGKEGLRLSWSPDGKRIVLA